MTQPKYKALYREAMATAGELRRELDAAQRALAEANEALAAFGREVVMPALPLGTPAVVWQVPRRDWLALKAWFLAQRAVVGTPPDLVGKPLMTLWGKPVRCLGEETAD